MVDGVEFSADAADLMRVDRRLHLSLRGGGTVMLPEGASFRVITGSEERAAPDRLLTIMLRGLLSRAEQRP